MATDQTKTESVTIAVMGATGAGKSTFINLVSNSKLRVGYGLESCTSEVQVAPPFLLNGKMVTLVDTPGFDDTVKTEAEILRLIADFLAITYEQGRRLNGIIFLHRISDHRMGGVARKNFRLFRKLCGDDTLKNVVIVTNMWADVSQEVGKSRENELMSNELFYKSALDKGAHIVRHDNTVASAHQILQEIVGFPPEPLLIQREMADEHKALAQTLVGIDLQTELQRQAAKHREELDGLKEEMAELMLSKDTKHKSELDELVDALSEVRGQLERVEEESRKIREQAESDRVAHEEQMRKLSNAMQTREKELRALEEQAQEQKTKIEEMQVALEAAELKARQEELRRQRLGDDMQASSAVYQEEIARLRKDFERKLEQARADSARVRERHVPPTQAQQQWSKVFAAQRERRGVFGAMSVMLESFWSSGMSR